MGEDIEYEKNELEEAIKRQQQKYLKHMTHNNNSCKHDYTLTKKICEELSINFMYEIAECSKANNVKKCKAYLFQRYDYFIRECIKNKKHDA